MREILLSIFFISIFSLGCLSQPQESQIPETFCELLNSSVAKEACLSNAAYLENDTRVMKYFYCVDGFTYYQDTLKNYSVLMNEDVENWNNAQSLSDADDESRLYAYHSNYYVTTLQNSINHLENCDDYLEENKDYLDSQNINTEQELDEFDKFKEYQSESVFQIKSNLENMEKYITENKLISPEYQQTIGDIRDTLDALETQLS